MALELLWMTSSSGTLRCGGGHYPNVRGEVEEVCNGRAGSSSSGWGKLPVPP